MQYFENESEFAVLSSNGVRLENRLDMISLIGNVDITCDQKGLALAREMCAHLQRIEALLALKSSQGILPQEIVNIAPKDAGNAFGLPDLDTFNHQVIKEKTLAWLFSGRVGLSSKAMAQCFSGVDGAVRTDHPCDPSDFNRCLMYLDAVPEAKSHLDKLRSLSPAWNKLIDNWALIESTFIDEVGLNWSNGCNLHATKTYNLMEKILHPVN